MQYSRFLNDSKKQKTYIFAKKLGKLIKYLPIHFDLNIKYDLINDELYENVKRKAIQTNKNMDNTFLIISFLSKKEISFSKYHHLAMIWLAYFDSVGMEIDYGIKKMSEYSGLSRKQKHMMKKAMLELKNIIFGMEVIEDYYFDKNGIFKYFDSKYDKVAYTIKKSAYGNIISPEENITDFYSYFLNSNKPHSSIILPVKPNEISVQKLFWAFETEARDRKMKYRNVKIENIMRYFGFLDFGYDKRKYFVDKYFNKRKDKLFEYCDLLGIELPLYEANIKEGIFELRSILNEKV